MKNKNIFDNISKERLLATSIGICYFWFGALKFFPALSPADALARDTIEYLTFGFIPSDISIFLLAVWEVIIGICLIMGLQISRVVVLAIIHMACTFTPLVFFPELSFSEPPFTPTLIGQYIIKNLVIITALMVIYPAKKPIEGGVEQHIRRPAKATSQYI